MNESLKRDSYRTVRQTIITPKISIHNLRIRPTIKLKITMQQLRIRPITRFKIIMQQLRIRAKVQILTELIRNQDQMS